ncbi:MAG: M48 family metallopeptidase [Deltaproteobacteria bacterium]|jgi:Zn-dependent protease with chaperone function|nr:M48 family metallopeptidase [Deltaproteobacteria bacterium]
MDFFASQDTARKKTSQLIIYMGLAVFIIIVAIYVVIMGFVVYQETDTGQFSPVNFWDLELFAIVALVTLLVVISGSLYKISILKSGGGAVAEMLGGKLIPAGTDDFLKKRLLNIVEEMAIASGVPVPPVYLLEHEKGINAFAAGFSPDDAVIGITQGALETLSRDELQGVIAHEFSHILNGDMKLDLKLVGILHGILLIALIGRAILRGSSRSRSKNSGGSVLFGLALLILGYVGVFFGKLIKSAVSRQREYLADASAVQFTRNTEGLAGALKKIGGLAAGSLMSHGKAEEISHMFFSNGLKASWAEAFSTHPPLSERITRLDPSFKGVYPKVARSQAQLQGKEEIADSAKIRGQEQRPAGAAVAALAVSAPDVKNVSRDIGVPIREHMEYARSLLGSLPAGIREAADNPFGARAVIYGLLLDRDETVRTRQMQLLKTGADKAVFAATEKILPLLSSLEEEARLPLMDLAMASLRSMSFEQFRRFEKNIDDLIKADKRISLFEFTLEHVVLRRLERNFVKPLSSVKVIRSVKEAAAETSAVLSLLANLGHENDEAREAFVKAAETFGRQGSGMQYLDREACKSIKLPEVLNRLAGLGPKVKQQLVDASFQCLVHDNRITMKEAEFFRLLVYALDCPLPPWVRI